MRFLLLAALPFLAAETHTVPAAATYNSFDHRHPVLKRIKPGDSVATKTLDAGGFDEKGAQTGNRGNPLTGPFFIEGAEPGDAIEIRLDRIRMNRNYGYSAYRLGLYAISPETVEGIYSRQFKKGAVMPDRDDVVKWNIDAQNNRVRLDDPSSQVHKLDFAAKPMLGCVGVAAPGVFGPTSGISGNYGGNMDYNRIVEGSTVILPVFHPGALLFVGDGHALQADGEPAGTGVETTMDVTFTVQLRKNAKVEGPRVITRDHIASVGSQPEFASSLDRSLRLATSDMIAWLTGEYKMEPWAAHLLIAYQGEYDVVTVAGSMALRIPKASLPAR